MQHKLCRLAVFFSPDLLIDKNNFYWRQGDLNVIPRKELGIKIEIYR